MLAGRGATVLSARRISEGEGAPDAVWSLAPGALRWEAKRLYAGCADGAVEITEVKPDGKQAMAAAAFAAGVQALQRGEGIWEGCDAV